MDARRRLALKNAGRFYTPKSIVETILNLAGYRGAGIARKLVVDNSCGDGAFLTEIVERYCRESVVSGAALKSELEEFIAGIEIDPEEREKCVANLDRVAAKRGVFGVRWNVLRADATTVDRFDGRADFVFGNPPYIRVHRLGAERAAAAKRFELAREGMTDAFLVFYELGLKALNSRGVLGYVSPNSFFSSLAGNRFRRRLLDENLLETIVDFRHFQAFDATTYSAIAVLRKNRTSDETAYFEYDGALKFVAKLRPDDFSFGGTFHFSTRRNLKFLKTVLNSESSGGSSGAFSDGLSGDSLGVGRPRNVGRFAVKNGFATLADSIFIGDDKARFGEFSIPVVKASTGKLTRCLFPYDRNGTLLSPEKIALDVELERYFQENAAALRRRSLTDANAWRGFGRTQGIKDVFRPKWAMNALIRDASDVKTTFCPPGTGVYSGLYILPDAASDAVPGELEKIVRSEEFATFVSLLGKCKSGGYYAFSSKELKAFLDRASATSAR